MVSVKMGARAFLSPPGLHEQSSVDRNAHLLLNSVIGEVALDVWEREGCSISYS